MATILFTCPATALRVQHWLDDGPDVPEQYEAVVCPACTRLHFLNRQTGKLLGHEKDRPASGSEGLAPHRPVKAG